MPTSLSISLCIVVVLVGSTNAQTEGEIRLRGGTWSSHGRVEIYHSGVWGTVCNDAFDVQEARVICRQIGHPNNNSLAFQRADFGLGTGQIWLDNLMCSGAEIRLTLCRHNGWGRHNCGHDEDASVDCNPANIAVRLIGGNSTVAHSGRLEVQYQGQWGTICDVGFTQASATVVCRQLGVVNGRGVPIAGAYYGQGTGTVLLQNVNCTGSETNFGLCQHAAWGSTSCGHDRDVSIICFPAGQVQPADVQIRLMGGLSVYSGRLEIAYKGIWGTVCNLGFSTTDANIFCGAMNMTGTARVERSFSLSGEGPVWLQNPQCRGNETHFLDCISKPFRDVSSSCSHSRDTVLECSTDSIPSYVMRFVSGNTSYDGRVELQINGVWGTICDTRWTSTEAAVACRQAGLSSVGAVPVLSSYYRPLAVANFPVYLQDVRCRGTEQSLSQCSHRYGPITATCRTHQRDVGVMCYPDAANIAVRLVSGSSTVARSGRLEVQYQGHWGTICDRGFTQASATVVCRQLGLVNGRGMPISGAYYGQGTGRVLLQNVNCTGSETSFGLCQHAAWGSTSCGHDRDVSIICFPAGQVQPADVQIRLMGGLSVYSGRLEIAYKGIWGTVCNLGFSTTDANIFCGAMNMTGTARVERSFSFSGEGPVWLQNLQCQGNETHFLDCMSKPFGDVSSFCSHSRDTVLECSTDSRPSNVMRVVSGNTSYDGRVELQINGVWGTICDTRWTSTEAAVSCRQAGLSSVGAVPVLASYYRPLAATYVPVYLQDIRCRGTEQSLSQCSHRYGPITATCRTHRWDAGVVCYPALVQPVNAVTSGADPAVTYRPGLYKMCLSCPPVSHPHDCRTYTEVWPRERCAVNLILLINGSNVYEFGYEQAADCVHADSPVPVHIRQRRIAVTDISLCHDCCTENFCNRKLCAIPERNSTNLVCLSGNAVTGLPFDTSLTFCDVGEQCYAGRVIHQSNPRPNEPEYANYANYGCASQMMCEQLLRYLPNVSPSAHCQGCCSKDGCNAQICQ